MTVTITRSFFCVDVGTLEVVQTGEGFLKARITVAKLGVFPYIEDGDIVWKAKLPEDLFSEETVDSIRGVPFVEDHPMENGKPLLLNPDNAKFFTRGNVSEPRIVGDKLQALATVTDRESIDKIQRGEKREVSIGFVFDEEIRMGSYDGKPFERVQKNIRVNHIAHVEAGRAGPEVRIHVDKKECIMTGEKGAAAGQKGKATDADKTFSYRLYDGSKDINVDSVAHTELMNLRDMLKEYDEKIKQFEMDAKDQKGSDAKGKVEVDKAIEEATKEIQTKLDVSEDKVKKLTSELKTSRDEMPKLVAEKAKVMKQLEEDARIAGVESIDGLDDRQIKLQICAKLLPFADGVSTDSLSDERIGAQYEAAMQMKRELVNKADGGKPAGDSAAALDDDAIEAKRSALSDVFDRTQEKLSGDSGKGGDQ